jgi:predicted enzyme related to lactoylglutathione lyase
VTITHVFARIDVAERDAAVAWYERLLGRPPDLIPNEIEAAWDLTTGGWLYIIADEESGPHASSVTLLVDDLDERMRALADRGVEGGPVETISGGARKLTVTDPDGNQIVFAQPGP